jgi:MoaA/NifB/PqqE/SkfB family radical SAM enzyme
MNFETAWKAVSFFLGRKNISDNHQIKFFGGEPLLNFQLVRDIINSVNKGKQNVNFRLATNGVLLSKKMLKFIKDNPNVELVISSKNIDLLRKNGLIGKVAELSLVTISINLFPGGLEKNVDQVEKLIEAGFSRFNFLPAYFVYWTSQEIKQLRRVLEKLAKIIQLSPQKIYIANTEIFSAVPLFNLTPTIDQEGDIYAGNFFLDKRFDSWKNELKLGNIRSAGTWRGIYDLSFDYSFLMNKIFSNDILSSTAAVDDELSRFVDYFK